MKAKLLHLFAVCMAMVTAIPVALANPANYKITFNSTAVATHQVSLYTSTGSAQQMSVANDVMYTIMPANSGKQVSYYDCSTKTLGAINTGSTNLISCGSATDDSGNLIVGVEQSFFYSTVNTIKVFKANKSGVVSTSSTKTYNLGRSGTNAFRTDMWHASGDIYGGNGSLWFSNGTYIVEVPIKNGTVQSIITHTTPSTPAGLSDNGWASQTRLAPYGNSNEFVYNNGQGVYDITINNSTITGTKLTDYSRHGGDIEYLRGHKIFARNANAAANDGYITIEDITTGTAQTIQSAFLVAQGVGGFTGQTNVWCEFKLIDDNTLALYTFVPKGGFSKYLITATPDVSNITSLSYKLEESNGIQNIKLSWTAPSKGVLSEYYIYRGNSLIGKTTATSYTDQNVFENATYKVVPVFDGVPEDSKYGATVTTTDVVTYTNPVQNLNATLVDGIKGDVNVTWAAPSAGSVSKYSISYSSDNGTTWSTAIETTSLSYSYNGLTTGTYIFKVKPYYSHAWGNEATSNSVTVINATGASISNLAYKYVKNTVTDIGRQDIVLMWEAPIGMVNTAVTGYKIYREGKLLATVGADVLTYTNTGVKQNYTYTVVPLFEGLTENSSYGQSVTTTEVTTTFVAPIISEIRNYEGYSLTELFYTMPDYMPYKPIYFNLYRDGKLIQGKLQAYNTLDESLVRSSETIVVKYQIEAVYGTSETATTPIDSVKSKEYGVTIAPRDWAKTGFILQEVYNVPIDEIAADKKPNLFDNNNYYRQGQFNTFDKKWYIAQRADNLSKHDENPESGGGQIDSNIAGTVGGIITINAENADDVKGGFEKIFTKPAFENVGIAIDDKGTIFVRNNNFDKLKATVPTGHGGEAAWGWMKDAFERRITEGTFYKRNENGTYSEVATKLDLQKIWTDNRWIDKMEFTGAASNGQVAGRTDYYNMYGDVLGDGGYLILSPSWTHTAFKVYIKGGVYQSHEVIEFDRYENGSYVLEPKTGTENYGFHLDGRDAVAVQIRSNGYFGVHTPWSADDWHPIFTAESRVNNAGGTSIQAFGKKITAEDVASEPDKYTTEDIGRHTGELLVITPQSMHSNNVGDFLISRAKKENANDFADEGTLLPSIPVVMKVQTDARSNSKATNANGNWFHAEVGTYASALNDNEECLDIYQYVPGTRFARYRLVQSNQFPQVTPVLNITTAYNDDITEITHFEGVATWNRPKGFGTSTGSANAKVKSYIFEMYNSKNELVASTELPEVTKEDGSPIDDTYEYKFDYTAETGKDDIDFGRYSVNVQVKYETKDGVEHLSEPSFAEASHDYVSEEASDRHIWMYKNANVTEDVWEYDEDKKDWVTVKKAFDNYRIELDFNAPTGTDEPVSYYTIHAYVNNKKDFIQISDFHLHKGAETVNGVTQAILDRDEKGNVIPTSQVPGTYIFDGENSWKAPFYKVGDNYEEVVGGQSRQTSVLTWHHKVPAGYYTSGVATTAEGDDITITDEPNNWKFVVVAHYAANNRSIAKSEEAQFSPELYDFITTGVEVVGDEASSLSIYPIPAHSTITIKANKTINSVVIYNEAGVEVMSEMGDGDNMLDVNIEHLATGFYFVKVNNYEPVKIIKK